ncbi:hypothetical protein DERP_002127 [Dermatophagoides pteronyssinus]|uniref:Uncharacterized protein n=1 Tax=Dermatophagoides pteronyssinus TaxID=6956 RepID=A0ABQ8JGU3_DERPT|nr:hypothetical protein DERP_002127 [Dermatophagoides pteronyssinus]
MNTIVGVLEFTLKNNSFSRHSSINEQQQQQQGYENYNGIKRRQFLMIKKNHNINMCMYHFNQYHDK